MVLPERRLEARELLLPGCPAQGLVALLAEVRGHEGGEEPALPRRRGVAVRLERDLVLLLPRDVPLARGDGGVLAHRQPRARLRVARDLRHDLARAQLAEQLHAIRGALRGIEVEQDAA